MDHHQETISLNTEHWLAATAGMRLVLAESGSEREFNPSEPDRDVIDIKPFGAPSERAKPESDEPSA